MESGYPRGERTLLKGNLMSFNPLARDRWRCSPGCFAACNARALHGLNPLPNPIGGDE